jgi:hypothetical protein
VTDADVEDIVAATKGYSGSDLTALCMESKHLPLSSTPAPSPFTLHPPTTRCTGPLALRAGHPHNFCRRSQTRHRSGFSRRAEPSACKVRPCSITHAAPAHSRSCYTRCMPSLPHHSRAQLMGALQCIRQRHCAVHRLEQAVWVVQGACDIVMPCVACVHLRSPSPTVTTPAAD